MKKKILFRGDGNSEIGLGHLYRLFALAEMFKDFFEFIFVTREDSLTSIYPADYTIERILANISYEQEAKVLAQKYSPSEYLIVADGYAFGSSYQKSIKEQGFTLVYVDDFAKEHMYADVVINHAPLFKKSDFSSESYTQFALGPKYAMIRPLFIQACKEKRQIDNIDSAFVCFGGADMYNLAEKTIKALLQIRFLKRINVVVGAANNSKLDSFLSEKVKIHKNLSENEMVNLLIESNLAVVPSSTILYEVCAVKMPVLSGYYIDNQKSIYKGFLKNNMIYGFGDFRKVSIDEIEGMVGRVLKNKYYQTLIHNQSKMIDGKIKERHLELINGLC
jgi:UDP-2,4-diacetamido-2,4,6-trideoxy-beta-L-altropyranose hydrolase